MNQFQAKTLMDPKPWEDESFQPTGNGLWKIPTMLTYEERKMLAYLTEHRFRGCGTILDLGCFLGGSSAFLAHGLSRNPFRKQNKVQSFDLFELCDFERTVFFPKNNLPLPPNRNTLELFQKHVRPWSELIEINQGNLLSYQWTGEPIEILFVDLMKSKELYNHVISQFLPCLIPGTSVMVLQDILFPGSAPWHSVLVEKLRKKLKPIGNTKHNSALYLCAEAITPSDVHDCLWENVSDEDRVFCLEQNAMGWDDVDHRNSITTILKNYLDDRTRIESKGAVYNSTLRTA